MLEIIARQEGLAAYQLPDGKLFQDVRDCMFVSPQHLRVEALTPSGMAFEGRSFGRQLGLNEVMRVGPP